jgi:hypothetical protein
MSISTKLIEDQLRSDIRFQEYRLSVVRDPAARRPIEDRLATLRDELFQTTRQPWQERKAA